jgi:hypothetical protein
MSFTCRLCHKQFAEIPIGAVEIGKGRRGSFRIYKIGEDIHDLGRTRLRFPNGAHERWHVQRGIKKADCEFCQSDAAPKPATVPATVPAAPREITPSEIVANLFEQIIKQVLSGQPKPPTPQLAAPVTEPKEPAKALWNPLPPPAPVAKVEVKPVKPKQSGQSEQPKFETTMSKAFARLFEK